MAYITNGPGLGVLYGVTFAAIGGSGSMEVAKPGLIGLLYRLGSPVGVRSFPFGRRSVREVGVSPTPI